MVGDAAGFTSGLTGEGIYFAMVSGMEVAKKIINKNYQCPKIKKILSIKKEHEKILKLLTINKNLTIMEYGIVEKLLNNKMIHDKLINIFAY